MLSSFLHSQNRDWLVVGSNGSIGSEILHSLELACAPEAAKPTLSCHHSHNDYGQAADRLLQDHSRGQPLRIVFCGGRGGFSLSDVSADEQQKAFEDFCRGLRNQHSLEKVVLISSLGAHCSEISSAYRRLVFTKEENVMDHLPGRNLILRLPSMYGWNRGGRRHHGLIGVLLRHLRLRRSTDIYARMETRRNYLSMNQLGPLLLRAGMGGICLDRLGIVNIQATLNLSIFDICTSFFRTTHLRPTVRLMEPSRVDAENHYPTLLNDANMMIHDRLDAWIKWQWHHPSRSFQ